MSSLEKTSSQTKFEQREEQTANMLKNLGEFVDAEVKGMFISTSIMIYFFPQSKQGDNVDIRRPSTHSCYNTTQ